MEQLLLLLTTFRLVVKQTQKFLLIDESAIALGEKRSNRILNSTMKTGYGEGVCDGLAKLIQETEDDERLSKEQALNYYKSIKENKE